jgi:hypothetical protein
MERGYTGTITPYYSDRTEFPLVNFEMEDHSQDKLPTPLISFPAGEEIPLINRISLARKTISRADYKNRYFKDVNALDATFRDCDFRYSYFERAYFRNATFISCNFEGTVFLECNLKGSNFYGCDLKFARFQRTLVELDDLIASLPAEPNIRQEVLQNLRANAIEVGDFASQSRLILQEVEAAKRHYRYALSGLDSYYKKKYLGYLPKFKAFARLTCLQLSGLVWGHGEKSARLLFSSAFLLLLLTILNFWSVLPRVSWGETHSGFKIFEYVVQQFLDMSPDSRFRGFAFVDYAAVVMRYIYIGLFISVLYKSISHR